MDFRFLILDLRLGDGKPVPKGEAGGAEGLMRAVAEECRMGGERVNQA